MFCRTLRGGPQWTVRVAVQHFGANTDGLEADKLDATSRQPSSVPTLAD
jgi:hypothetical protein